MVGSTPYLLQIEVVLEGCNRGGAFELEEARLAAPSSRWVGAIARRSSAGSLVGTRRDPCVAVRDRKPSYWRGCAPVRSPP